MQSRVARVGFVVLLSTALLSCSSKPDRTAYTVATDPDHYIIIKACDQITDGYDPTSQATTIPQGEYAVWLNQSGQEVTLQFGNAYTLFGVEMLVVPAWDQRSLQVLPKADVRSHDYRSECVGGTQPGATIIVTRPGG